MKQKVFCIGFHRTGTTSMAFACRTLGYKVAGHVGYLTKSLSVGDFGPAFELAKKKDAFEDTPWCIIYKELDKKFPNSKFILTIREPDNWFRSVRAYFKNRTTPTREWVYGKGNGNPVGNKKLYIKRYNRHNKEVMEYFKDRPSDLLVINLENGHGWKEICRFLDKPIPKKSFPHKNRTGKGNRKKGKK